MIKNMERFSYRIKAATLDPASATRIKPIVLWYPHFIYRNADIPTGYRIFIIFNIRKKANFSVNIRKEIDIYKFEGELIIMLQYIIGNRE